MATKTRELADFLIEGSSDLPLGKPHITPGVLQPAIAGKLLNGATHSGAYGTAQTQSGGDGHKYYYTDIKGSKAIKDPRIGAHFGSQRHKFKSMQLLEQETTTHGKNVYSIDGREWVRACGSNWGSSMKNGSNGLFFEIHGSSGDPANHFIEITGYFNAVNMVGAVDNVTDQHLVSINGTANSSATDLACGHSGSPLVSRYVDHASVYSLSFNSAPTLGINTVKFNGVASFYMSVAGCELIAQDTTSTATKSKIQIPSQNVVSYGKKFTVSGTPHYNPFATKGDGSASTIPNNTTGDSVATGWAGSTSAYWDSSLDTATSLGLGAWESGGNFYRPVNGGRVVKWVDSTGTIKTSVNMMPPEAHAIENSVPLGDSAATGTHNWSTVYQPQFGNKITGSDLITNGTFSSNTTGWTAEGNTTIASTSGGQSGNCLTMTRGTGTSQTVKQTYASFVVGRWYKMSAYIKQGTDTGGSINLRAEGAAASHYPQGPGIIATGSFVKHSMVFKAETTSYDVMLRGYIDTDGQTMLIDTLTLHEIEHPETQAEVAKTFHWREFGNGSANGGTNATYADFSMVSTAGSGSNGDEVAYVMDDGLTSMNTDHAYAEGGTNENVDGIRIAVHTGVQNTYFTFIGTGFSAELKKWDSVTFDAVGNQTLVENLPYGTHIVKIARDNTSGDYVTLTIDGVQILREVFNVDNKALETIRNLSFHQPKMPPIPEDAVVLADYMLMADYVAQATGASTEISKGVRSVHSSRDSFYNGSGTFGSTRFRPDASMGQLGMIGCEMNSALTVTLPFFGTKAISGIHSANEQAHTIDFAGSTDVATTTINAAAGASFDKEIINTAGTLGIQTVTSNCVSGYGFEEYHLVSPIHTSSHYQTFETPFLHELVGGDRNMEQTNLVVTADGKTWDEATRDTSYIGASSGFSISADAYSSGAPHSAYYIFNEYRGVGGRAPLAFYNKDFAIAYDKMLCLNAGLYTINWMASSRANDHPLSTILKINGVSVMSGKDDNEGTERGQVHATLINHLKRGDYLQIYIDQSASQNIAGDDVFWTRFQASRIN